jgi:DNA-binding transcriptional MerR regulator
MDPENLKPITWKELSQLFGLDQRTIRRWIQENMPEIKVKKNKRTFTASERKMILSRWADVCE